MEHRHTTSQVSILDTITIAIPWPIIGFIRVFIHSVMFKIQLQFNGVVEMGAAKIGTTHKIRCWPILGKNLVVNAMLVYHWTSNVGPSLA